MKRSILLLIHRICDYFPRSYNPSLYNSKQPSNNDTPIPVRGSLAEVRNAVMSRQPAHNVQYNNYINHPYRPVQYKPPQYEGNEQTIVDKQIYNNKRRVNNNYHQPLW